MFLLPPYLIQKWGELWTETFNYWYSFFAPMTYQSPYYSFLHRNPF